MGSAFEDKISAQDLAVAKSYIRTAGNAFISRSYFKETHEIDRFIGYVEGLTQHYEASLIKDWSPEQSANRIFDFMMSFFNMYGFQWKQHGRAQDKTLQLYVETTRECLDFGYIKISEKFESLPKELKETVNKAFFLINERIDKWHNEKLLEISAA
jgi:hypothetical protein